MSSEGDARLGALLAEIRAEFPRFRLVRKDESRLQRALHWALCAITFGQMRDYLRGYHTTMGQVVYVTPDWDRLSAQRRYEILRHERVHLRQFRRYGLVGMTVLYVLLPLPMGLAYFRARFEMAAYAESVRAAAECHGLDRVRDPAFRARMVRHFTGPSYGWMWPFRRSVERWYDGVVAQLDSGRERM